MAIFKCDSCGYDREVPDKLVGKKAKCPECGHGVTIVNEVVAEDDSFESAFEESDEAVEEVSRNADDAGVEASPEAPQEAHDLDDVDGEMGFVDPDDVICPECGHVVDDESIEFCPECGGEMDQEEALPDLSEDDVDISDLIEEDTPQVWDENYSSGEDSDEGEFVDTVAPKSSWRLLEGNLPLNLFAGLVSGILGFFFAVSLSLLVCTQDGLQGFLPYILTTSLTAMTIGCFFYTFGTRIPFSLAGPETVLVVVLLLFTGSIYRDMAGEFSSDVILSTILGAIALTAVLTGLALWMLGKFKIGEHVRYIPIQIIGGVIGGVGILALFGAFDWIGGYSLDWSNSFVAIKGCIAQFKPMESLHTMGPSVVFGIVLFVALAKHKNSFFMLAVILVAAGAGYGAGLWGQSDVVQSLSVSLPYLEDGSVQYPIEFLKSGYTSIQWGIIKAHGLYIGVVAALAILTTMYRVTSLELIQGRETDLGGEYKTLGLVNMLSGLCCGMPVSLSYGRSAGSHASGGRGPVAGLVAGLVCGAGLFFADYLIPLIPRYVPEGLLVFAGLDLIRDWMIKTKSAFTRRDDLWMLWAVFLTTVVLGLQEGIAFGVALALIVTVGRNSKGGAVRNILSGANHRSNVDRAAAQQRALKEFGDHIHILRLQGFMSLGSMQLLLKGIRDRMDDRDKLPVEYLLLDFRLVTGFASAAGIAFDKLRNVVNEYGIEVIITSAPFELAEHLEESGHVGDAEGQFKAFMNLDFAMEWCENRVLDSENMLEMKSLTLPELLEPIFPEPKYIPALMKVLKRVDVAKGDAVFRQGDESDSMYFVESGRLDVELELEGGKLLRLKKVGPGAVFGEMGIYTMAPRSATVRAAEKCVLYTMTMDKLQAVEKRAPMLVTAINRFLINMMSDRLLDANIKVRDLMM